MVRNRDRFLGLVQEGVGGFDGLMIWSGIWVWSWSGSFPARQSLIGLEAYLASRVESLY